MCAYALTLKGTKMKLSYKATKLLEQINDRLEKPSDTLNVKDARFRLALTSDDFSELLSELNYTPIGEDELDKKMAELWDSHGPFLDIR